MNSYIQLPSLIPSDTDGQKLAAITYTTEILAPVLEEEQEALNLVYMHKQVFCDKEGKPIGVSGNPLIIGNEIFKMILLELHVISRLLHEGLFTSNTRGRLENIRANVESSLKGL